MNNKKPNNQKIFHNISLAVSALAFAVFFGYMMIYTLLFSRTTESMYDKQLTSAPEFSFNKFFLGSYTTELSKYFTDTVHNRDGFKENASIIKSYYGIPEEEEDFFVGTDPDVSEPDDTSYEPPVSQPDTSSPSDSSDVTSEPDVSNEPTSDVTSEPDVSDDPDTSDVTSTPEPPVNVGEEILENIVLLGSGSNVRAMEVFYHVDSAARKYAERVNAFASKLDGVNVYSMVVPKQCAYYIKDSKKYGYTADNSLKTDTVIKNNLNGVTYVNVYGALEKHISEEIYARTDHHWTALGAFYAAEEFAKTAGVPFASIDKYELNRRAGYVGTMYTFTKSAKLLNNPEDFLTLVPKFQTNKALFYNKNYNFVTEHDVMWTIPDKYKSGWYSTFLGNDEYIAKISSATCSNGRRLLVIKDSYGNALSPLLNDSFEQIIFCDLRYTNVNIVDLINDNQITDVLFAICSYSAVNNNISGRIDTLTTIGK